MAGTRVSERCSAVKGPQQPGDEEPRCPGAAVLSEDLNVQAMRDPRSPGVEEPRCLGAALLSRDPPGIQATRDPGVRELLSC